MFGISILLLLSFGLICSPVSSLAAHKQLQQKFHHDVLKRSAISASRVATVTPEAPVIAIKWRISHFFLKNQRDILSLILTSTYMSIVLGVMSLPVSLSAIYSDVDFCSTSISSNLLSKIVSVANIVNVSM